jgi:glutamyl-tRNA(Gln) amidotransferase subunit D
MSAEEFSHQTENVAGVVIAGTGLGHVHQRLIPAIQNLTDRNIPVVMTSQCLWGRVNMQVYSVGRKLLQAGVISGKDMMPETALIKLMWVLANCDDVPAAMTSNRAGEITSRTLFDTYPQQKKYM